MRIVPSFVRASKPGGGRLVPLRGRLVLYKVVRAARHALRVPPAWSFDEGVLRDAGARGAEWVVLKDIDSGWFFAASLRTVHAHGFRVSRGFGEQRALPARWWGRGRSVEEAINGAMRVEGLL